MEQGGAICCAALAPAAVPAASARLGLRFAGALALEGTRVEGGIVGAKGGGEMVHQKTDGFAGIESGIVFPMKDGIGEDLLAAHKIILFAAAFLAACPAGRLKGD